MFGNVLAQHTPYLQGWREVVVGDVIDPACKPQPPSDEPITCSFVTRASLFGVVGSETMVRLSLAARPKLPGLRSGMINT